MSFFSQSSSVTLKDLTKALQKKYETQSNRFNHCDEIVPGLFLGDAAISKNLWKLKSGEITHIVNTVHKIPPEQPTSYFALGLDEEYYNERGLPIHFKGFPILDNASFPIDQFFEESSQFIDDALNEGGRVLVHCILGISRSATLVIAYLMLKRDFTAIDAVNLVRQKRYVHPNIGFLRQICNLDAKLHRERKRSGQLMSQTENVEFS